MNISLSLMDVCTPDYLLNHCNGDSEMLLAVAVDGATTLQEVMSELESEFRSDTSGKLPDVTDEMFAAAVAELPAPGTTPESIFDPGLELPNDADDCGESVYAYFRLSVEEADS
jgi:hypothetical protein